MELDIPQANFEDRVTTIIVIGLKYIYFFLELFYFFIRPWSIFVIAC